MAAESVDTGRSGPVVVTAEEIAPHTGLQAAEGTDLGAPRVHPFGNVLSEVRVLHGDPDAEAEVWVEGYYETGMQDQAPLGPDAGMAVPAEDGGVDLFVATQWLHIDRRQLAPAHADPAKYPQFAQQKLADNIKPEFIGIEELVRQLKAGAKPVIVDVRAAEEFREAHILSAVSAPLAEFKAYVKSMPRDRLLVLY